MKPVLIRCSILNQDNWCMYRIRTKHGIAEGTMFMNGYIPLFKAELKEGTIMWGAMMVGLISEQDGVSTIVTSDGYQLNVDSKLIREMNAKS